MAKKSKQALPFKKPGKVNTSPKLSTGKKRGRPAKVVSAAPEVSVEIEVPDAPLNLGEIVLPTKDEALKVLQELATMNDAVLQAQKRWADAAARAKRLKGEWDDLAEALSKRLRYATHKAPMPLFDQAAAERERDQALKNQIVPAAGPGETFPAADGAAEGSIGVVTVDEKADSAGEVDPGQEIAPEAAEDYVPF